MSYKRRGGDRETYAAEISDDGNIIVDGHSYSAPSYAALHCIQKAGSSRNTVNGWTRWRCEDGRFISDLRADYIANKVGPNNAVQPMSTGEAPG